MPTADIIPLPPSAVGSDVQSLIKKLLDSVPPWPAAFDQPSEPNRRYLRSSTKDGSIRLDDGRTMVYHRGFWVERGFLYG